MTEQQLYLLRHLIKQEIDAANIDGMEHGTWGWADKQLEEGWKCFKDSFKSTSLTTMTYDYKRLCNELLSYLYQCDWPDGEKFYALVERTRTALAEPEPEKPTRRQLMMLADDMGMASVGDAAEYAHAVLARWGNHPGFPDSSAQPS